MLEEVFHVIFHAAADKEELAPNDWSTFYSGGWTVSQPRIAAKAGNLCSQEESRLSFDLQLSLCILSTQMKACTYTHSCWFGDITLSFSNKSNILVQAQLYPLSLCFLHIFLTTLSLKPHMNTLLFPNPPLLLAVWPIVLLCACLLDRMWKSPDFLTVEP